jgi:hypothetical protein
MRLLGCIEALCLAALLGLAGCALTPRSVAREVAAATPPAAIRSTLQALNDAENQRLLRALLASPELRAASRALAEDLADGALATLDAPARAARIERLTARYLATLTLALTRSLADGLRRDLSPALAAAVRDALAGALREGLREEHQLALARMAEGVSRAAVASASRAAAEGVQRDLAPSLRAALLDTRTAEALTAVARTLARGVVLGSNDAMTQLQQQQARTGRPSFLGSLSNLTQDSVRLVQWVALGAVAIALLLGVWVLRLTLRGRRVRAERDRHADDARVAKERAEILKQRVQGAPAEGVIDAAFVRHAPE